ncbi:hypothetical protein LRR80_05645 [Streptomyces sp. RO-S4]|uniref:hypothetical protein n=1 Tax=unclassified Streptomyces TaxID=2593676 RepID=UPI00208E3DA2|nr:MULTISPECIES: hypothetical protein [unclassified Streptomyces]MCO4699549.1 hypothetical protein [Streptomyces sp. RO-S4]MDU0301757.1 hypothetical protein [Streptomyces sp. PAL114]
MPDATLLAWTEWSSCAAAAAALEEARFDARQAFRHEDLADDVRGQAELAEWERLAQLLADAAPGTVYNPEADAVRAELREAARIEARADELQALRELGTLEQTEPRTGDEAARDKLTRRAGGYVQADVDAWLAQALAAHLGHYRDPAAREEAASLLTPLLRDAYRVLTGEGFARPAEVAAACVRSAADALLSLPGSRPRQA